MLSGRAAAQVNVSTTDVTTTDVATAKVSATIADVTTTEVTTSEVTGIVSGQAIVIAAFFNRSVGGLVLIDIGIRLRVFGLLDFIHRIDTVASERSLAA